MVRQKRAASWEISEGVFFPRRPLLFGGCVTLSLERLMIFRLASGSGDGVDNGRLGGR